MINIANSQANSSRRPMASAVATDRARMPTIANGVTPPRSSTASHNDSGIASSATIQRAARKCQTA